MNQRILFECRGRVARGKQMGRKLGFPTANVQPNHPMQGAKGVYAGFLNFGEGDRLCVVNVGSHPTLPEGALTIEAHVIGYAGDLYGKEVTLRLTHFLRGEQKFPSLEALSAQLAMDVEKAIELSGGNEA